jgi:hypothetical protein
MRRAPCVVSRAACGVRRAILNVLFYAEDRLLEADSLCVHSAGAAACLTIPRLANLIFVSLVGPSLEEFQPLPYVKQWLLAGHHAACDNKSRKCKPENQDNLRYGHMSDVFI